MAIDILEETEAEWGKSLADLGTWAAQAADIAELSAAYDKLTEEVVESTAASSAYAKAAAQSSKASGGLAASLTMLTASAVGGSSSLTGLISGLVGLAVTTSTANPILGVLAGAFTTLTLKMVALPFQIVTKGFRAVGDLAKWAAETGLTILIKIFEKLKQVALKVAKFVVSAFKKIASTAVDLSKKAALGVVGFVAALVAAPIALDKLFQKVMEGPAKLQGIKAAFLATGEGAAEMFAALKKGSSGMVEDIDLMEQYNSALLLVNKSFADTLPEALIYFTKIALATGEDMDYLIDSYVRGVGRLSPKILDNLKIQVSMAEATAWASAEYGKATAQLTVYEKQQGFAAVTMEKLRAKTAGLADVTGSLTHLMAVYNVQQAENSRLLAGHFLPVAKSFYSLMIKVQEMFRASISEGGKYYNVLRKLSAGFAGLIEAVGELVGRFSTGGSEAVDAFADKMFEAAWNAFSWGANIINNLAIGMARGIATTLMTVINMLSDFLGYWLSPGSAPNIVPNLLSWGAATFTEYLRGFTMADFGILTGVQAPLQGALQNLVSLGTITDEQSHEMFISISEAMAAAIATGDIEAAMAALAGVGAEYGAELEELFKRQLAVADATKALEDAELRLTAARDLAEASGKQLSREARDYNRLLREGASEEVLAAKLAEMKATYETLEGARDAAEIAEDDKALAEAQLAVQQDLMEVQSALLEQLILMGQAWADMGDGDGDGWLPDPDEILPPFESMIGEIDQAFEDLKNSIRDKFLGLWADLVQDWKDSDVGQLVELLKETWEKSELKKWWVAFWLDVEEDGMTEALKNLWTKLAITTQAFLDEQYPAWGEVWRAFTEKGIEDGTGAVEFMPALSALWVNIIAPGIQQWLDEHDSWWADVWASFTGTGIRDGSGDVEPDEALEEFWSKLKTSLWDSLDVLMLNFGFYLGEKFTDLLHGLAVSVLALIAGTLGSDETATETESHAAGLASSFVEGLWAGLVEGFENKKEFWGAMLQDWFGYGVQEAEYYLGMQSASTVFRDLAYGMIDGLEGGMNEKIGQVSWSSMAETVKSAFVSGLSGMGEAIKGSFNSVIDVIERAVDHVITGTNNLIWAIGAATGVWIPTLSYIDFPRLAEGGLIQATEQLAVLHQHEVVLPLKDPRTVDLMADAMRGAFGQIREADAAPAGTTYKIDLHFGRDSVRSERDIMMIADKVQRAMELKGVRGNIG